MADLILLRRTKLRIVVLESPCDSLQLPLAQEVFAKTIALKLKGYGAEYPYGVLAVDAIDFICTHLAVFKESGSEFMPLMAYKSTLEPKCRAHRLAFPAISVVASSGAEQHAQAVQRLIEDSRQTGSTVLYGGGWTIEPEARKDRGLVAELKNLFTLMQVRHHQELGRFDSICCGAPRFKTERVFRGWGYEPLKLRGKELPHFEQASLFGEEAQMFHATSFSQSALKTADLYQELWDKRILIGKAGVTEREKKAA